MPVLVRMLWIIQHGLSPILLSKKYRHTYFAISAALFGIIYIFKYTTSDIYVYWYFMDNPEYFLWEPAYRILSIVIDFLVINNQLGVTIIQVLTAILFFYLAKIFSNKTTSYGYTSFIIIVSSLAFTLGVNNVVRQAISSVFIVLWLFYYINDKKTPAFVFAILASTFHKSGILFIFTILAALFFGKKLYFITKEQKNNIKITTVILYIIVFIFSLVGLLLLLRVVFFIPGYADYFTDNFSRAFTRTPSYIKVMPIFMIFIVSELLFGKYSRDYNVFNILRFLRIVFMLFILSLSIFSGLTGLLDEAVARIMYFYYVLELSLMLSGLAIDKKRGIVLINLGYALAINAMNVLGGPIV